MKRLLWTVPELTPPHDLEVIVRGAPVPSGIRPVPIKGRDGQTHSRLAEGRDSQHEKRIKSWRARVAAAGVDAMAGRDVYTGPVAVELRFLRPRTVSQLGTGRNSGQVKASTPAFPTTRPDVLKLARLVEDALTAVVWKDDAQIVDERLVKIYVPQNRPPGVRVRVWQLFEREQQVQTAIAEHDRLERLIVPQGEQVIAQLEGVAEHLETASVAMLDPVEAARELRELARRMRVEGDW